MLTVLGILAALAVLFVAASLATRDGDVLQEAPRDRADVDLPAGPLQPEDVGSLRFGMALRGYRMSEVDDVLDRVATELATRDARIRELEREPASPEPLYAAIDPTVRPVVEPIPAPGPAALRAEQPVSAASGQGEEAAYTGQQAPADDAAFAGPDPGRAEPAPADRLTEEPTGGGSAPT